MSSARGDTTVSFVARHVNLLIATQFKRDSAGKLCLL